MIALTIEGADTELTWATAPAVATRWAESMGTEYSNRDLLDRNLMVAMLLERCWAMLNRSTREAARLARAEPPAGQEVA